MRCLLLSMMLLLASCSKSSNLIRGDGSSTVFPITEAVAEEFQAFKKGSARMTVGISGTGGGFKKFCRGETDIQNASRPIQSKEMESCRKAGIKYFGIPVGFDAIAVVVNPNNDWVSSISVEELKAMWAPEAQGKIKKWRDLNPKWPDLDLKLYGAGADSGTFDYFTEAIAGKAKKSRGDYTASEDDNTLVLGVSNDKGAIGYLPLAYYESNKDKLKILALIGGEKSPKKNAPVLPTTETVIDGTYYPLSRPMFVYVSASSYQKPDVKEFVEFFLKNAEPLVTEVGYIPLPRKSYDEALRHLSSNRLGTAFGGHSKVGLTIEQIMKLEVSL